MKTLLTTSILLLSFHGISMKQPSDTTPSKKFFKQISFQLNWLEFGGIVPFEQKKLSSLEKGLNHYYSPSKNFKEGALGLFGGTFYYKNKIGVGLMYMVYEFNNSQTNYLDYLVSKYPNYYVPEGKADYSYESSGFSLSVSYRKHFKYFIMEPKIRACFSSLPSTDFSLWMKERGSNRYMEIELKELRRENMSSYHAIVALTHQFKSKRRLKWEVGLQSEFFVTPIKGSVILSEKVFGEDAVRSEQNISRWNPALAFSFFVNWKFGRKG